MEEKKPSPLQASFWLSTQEKYYILILCALFFIGVVARYFYLKKDPSTVYTPAGIEELEAIHE